MSSRDASFKIICRKCKKRNLVHGQDLEYDSSSYPRQMGAEVEVYTSHDFNCEKCGNSLSFEYQAYEYPVGVYNYSNLDVSGGEGEVCFDEFTMFQDVVYDLNEESGFYVPDVKIVEDIGSGVAEIIIASEKNKDLLSHITPREFEEFVAEVFKRHGFSVELTKQTRDGGRDIIAIRSDLCGDVKYIIECKRYTSKIGVDLVRNLHGVQDLEGANKSVLVTTSTFSSDAKKLAQSTENIKWGLSLRDFDDILKWAKELKTMNNQYASIF